MAFNAAMAGGEQHVEGRLQAPSEKGDWKTQGSVSIVPAYYSPAA